jgi:hypothetical protein
LDIFLVTPCWCFGAGVVNFRVFLIIVGDPGSAVDDLLRVVKEVYGTYFGNFRVSEKNFEIFLPDVGTAQKEQGSGGAWYRHRTVSCYTYPVIPARFMQPA